MPAVSMGQRSGNSWGDLVSISLGARALVAVMAAAAIAGACSTASDKPAGGGATGSTTAGTARTATARGVTADTITIGYAYPDLESLAKTGLIKTDNGPYAPIMQALVDDVNARGGIDGRKLRVVSEKYSLLDSNDQLRVCTKLVEDDKVFAVLGGFVTDSGNLCVVGPQHATMLLTGIAPPSAQLAAQAKAPWASYQPSNERAVKALVALLDQQGRLKGKKIGVLGNQSKSDADLAVKALQDAGYTVTDTAVIDTPVADQQAFLAQVKVLGNRFKDKGVQSLVVVDTTPWASAFDAIGWHPELYFPSTGVIIGAAYTEPLAKMALVAGLSPRADPSGGFDTPIMRACRDAYQKATGKVIQTLDQENAAGKSTGFGAMQDACSELTMFVDGAKAAGANLDYDSWVKGLESVGPIQLPYAPSSFAPGKLDGQDAFQLVEQDPKWNPRASTPEFLPLGQPISVNG
jgi:hypothetical protein